MKDAADHPFADAILPLSAIAAQLLGWKPGEFWAATPAELACSLREPGADGHAEPPTRALIERLMERDR